MTEMIINPSVVRAVLIGPVWHTLKKGSLCIHGYKFIDEERESVIDTCRVGFSFVDDEGTHLMGPLKSLRAFAV